MLEINRNRISKRQYIVFLVFIIAFLFLSLKILQIQHFDYKKLSVMANSQYSYSENTTDARFLLFDCTGKELLNYNKKYYAVISPNIFRNDNKDLKSEDILTLVYTLRNYNRDYDISKSGELNSSQKLYYEVDESTYEKLRKLNGIKGFYTYEYDPVDKSGVWSIENLLINPNRTKDSSKKSKDSIEMQLYEKTKDNKIPQIVFKKDVNNKIIGKYKNTQDSNVNVRLTLNKKVEDSIKTILNNSYNRKYNQIGVVLMEANTGAIRAIVQKDDTKPNVNLGVATNHGFFPGSIFKVLVEESGLDKNKISVLDKFVSRGLYEEEEEEKTNKGATFTPKEALIASNNDVFAQIGDKIGFQDIYNNLKAHGLLKKVLNFDQEKEGELEMKNPKISDGTLGLTSIGQNIRITPIEAISIPNTVVNSGVYVKPHIIDAYVDNNNRIIEKENYNSSQIIKQSTADEMKSQMIDVVKKGTGTFAYLDDVEIGGKTGTTQRMELSEKTNSVVEHSDGWFVGFFNLKGKNYSMVVFVEDINKNTQSGGNTAAPIFKQIVLQLKNSMENN
ncbi:penicillin-binding protein 2 [Clostridium sp. cel8]|jgi:cell division protein FtsI/penicillin-binding protein 2|uniref:penicillin-binding transpeptidase domain-containing protein n=1 Tax=unclassified Clostridium TaxID=2614128 RepID=UPI0015F68CE7|nr:penicillin-binding transpeptidase domain-containing protein [Clostridium sp. cel8]MBA5850556.1 penicillin-binding protein 2 [Clostridium sp. cel8]